MTGAFAARAGGGSSASDEPILGVLRPAAVVLNRPYPVEIRGQRTLREHDASRCPLRQVERFLVARLEREASVPQRLQPDRDRKQHEHGGEPRYDRRPEASRHLKSRREKINAPPMSSIAM